MTESAYTAPVLVQEGDITKLSRVGLGRSSEFSYDEAWLQKFLFDHIDSIPVEDVDSSVSELLPICCELTTSAGPLDILCVSEQGKLVVIEVKLWRNPEARRKVVAQVMDYAKELNRWDYEDLQREVSKKLGKKGNVLYEIAKNKWKQLEESTFVDQVSRSLCKGDFLLLIIGDGIQEGTENIADFMNNVGRLQFTLGLIETSIWQIPQVGMLIQPKILAKTVIIDRIVIDLLSPEISITEDDSESEAKSTRQFFTAFWQEYINQMQLDDISIPHSTPTAENFYLYPGKNKQSWISAFIAKRQERVGVYYRAPKGEYGQLIYEQLKRHRKEIEAQLGGEASWEDQGKGEAKYITVSTYFPDVHSPDYRQEIFDFYNVTINNFVNIFRPLLKDFGP